MDNLAKHYETLTHEQRTVIQKALRDHGWKEAKNVSFGMLPFVEGSAVLFAMHKFCLGKQNLDNLALFYKLCKLLISPKCKFAVYSYGNTIIGINIELIDLENYENEITLEEWINLEFLILDGWAVDIEHAYRNNLDPNKTSINKLLKDVKEGKSDIGIADVQTKHDDAHTG